MRARRGGFTLIELMVVVSIIGILAAIAIPSFIGYVRRSKTSEAMTNLNVVFKAASSFYSTGDGRAQRGINGGELMSCVVPGVQMTPSDPGPNKSPFVTAAGDSFGTLNIDFGGFVYYGYGIDSVAEGNELVCNVGPNADEVYTFYAHGDLDGNGIYSTFELAVATNDDNALYHARGFYVANEIE